jgi:hypothetical protein
MVASTTRHVTEPGYDDALSILWMVPAVIDFPISFAEDAISGIVDELWTIPSDRRGWYHAYYWKNVAFHGLLGGGQYFLWGYLFALLAQKLRAKLRRASRGPSDAEK